MQEYLAQTRRILRALGRYVWRILTDADLFVTEPVGGFYLFPDFSAYRNMLIQKGINTSGQLCERILEDTGVAMLPGTAFGRPGNEFTVRLAYVDFNGAKAIQAAEEQYANCELSLDYLRTYCPNVIIAVEQITTWLLTSETTVTKPEDA